MTAQVKPAFWRNTPPAVFPSLMGLFGLGLAWRRGAEAFAFGPAVGDVILGATTLIFAVFFGAYMVKFLARPEALLEDLRVLPGRAGLAASSLSVLLLAAAMVPLSERAATFLLTCGLIWHGTLMILMGYVLARSPAPQRKATPAWHLAFVGFIVAPLSAAPLGFDTLALALFFGTIAIAVTIYAISIEQLQSGLPPAPLRPLLAIHLAPVSLFGTVAVTINVTSMALAFLLIASGVFLALLFRVRALTESGFSPLWGAFTFPLAAYAGLVLALAEYGSGLRIFGGLVLIAATLIIPVIAAKVLQLWIKGTLAKITNASVA